MSHHYLILYLFWITVFVCEFVLESRKNYDGWCNFLHRKNLWAAVPPAWIRLFTNPEESWISRPQSFHLNTLKEACHSNIYYVTVAVVIVIDCCSKFQFFTNTKGTTGFLWCHESTSSQMQWEPQVWSCTIYIKGIICLHSHFQPIHSVVAAWLNNKHTN